MIGESHYWKNGLIGSANKLIEWQNKKLTERSFFNIEKEIMVGFYSIRKLIEAKKISTYLENKDISVMEYKALRAVTRLNWSNVDRNYDFENKKEVKVNILQLCNYIIHSYVYIIATNAEGGLNGLLFNSDKIRNEKIFYVDIDQIINIFREVGLNYPSHQSKCTFSEKKMDYIIVQE